MLNRILVVDDDYAQRALLHEILSFDGLLATCVGDGIEAEREIRQNPPDLVLLDVNIPHKNGFEICAGIKKNPEAQLIPVIMITGLSQTSDRIRGLEAGADDFLTKPIDRIELQVRVRGLLRRKECTDELDRAEHVLMALGAGIEAKDHNTEHHCDRISAYSLRFGAELGLGHEDLRALRIAGSVHDIGKIAVPDAILLKRGPLLPVEWQIMRQHPIAGEQICKPLRSFRLVLPIIRHHHEKRDGTGYPDQLSGENIPLLARVMQITDVFDALTSDRPYRTALTVCDALAQMNTEVRSGWWDERLFPIFASLVQNGVLDKTLKENSRAC